MTFSDLLETLLRHRVVAATTFLLCLLLGAAAAFLPETRYRSTVTLIVQPTGGETGDAFGAVETARFVLPALAEVVATESFRSAVRQTVPAAQRAVPPSLSAAPETGTPILRVSAEGTVPAVAEVWANAAARQLIDRNPSGLVTISVIDPARVPTEPSGPLRLPIVLGSTVSGVIAAVFAALAANALRRRVGGPEDFRRRFGVEVLGDIPASRKFAGLASQTFAQEADPVVQEAYQRLRTNFDLRLMSSRVQVLAVTSFALGEGKTSVVANLAWAMAKLGQEVVAVDGDVRRPALAPALGVPGSPGLAQASAGADAKSLLHPTDLPNLNVIPAGGIADNPLDVVTNALPRLLGDLEGFDRLVLVDTPPLVVAEASLIAALTKSVVLVVDAKARNVDDVAKTLDELRLVGADILGVVLNRSRRRRSGSSYYYYQQRSRLDRRRRGARPRRSDAPVGEGRRADG